MPPKIAPAQAEETWRAFNELLEAEHAALIANDAERVAALAEQKSKLALALAKLARPANPQASALIASAKALNQANSLLLQQRLAHNQRALAALRPGAVQNAATVYGRDGRTGRAAPAGATQPVGVA
jgi:flagellar biosynthesis/type III secretory pathway chaperone